MLNWILDKNSFSSDQLIKNSVLLILSAIAIAVFGFVFWIVVTNGYTPQDVGLASSLITLSVWLAIVSRFGFEEGLQRYIPESPDQTTLLINSVLFSTFFSSLFGGLIFIIPIVFLFPTYGVLKGSVLFFIIFSLLILVTNIFSIQRAIFISKRANHFVLVLDIIWGLIRIPFPLLFVSYNAIGILLGLLISYIISIFPLGYLFLKSLVSEFKITFKFDKTQLKKIIIYSGGNSFANLVSGIPRAFLPFIVVIILSAADGGYFYIAWMIAGIFYSIPYGTSVSLTVEGSYTKVKLWEGLKKATIFTIILIIPVIIGINIFGEVILGLYGRDYSENSIKLLRLMIITILPYSVNTLFFAICRVKKVTKTIIVLNLLIALITITGSIILLPGMGLSGVGYSWLFAHTLTAIISLAFLFNWKYFQGT